MHRKKAPPAMNEKPASVPLVAGTAVGGASAGSNGNGSSSKRKQSISTLALEPLVAVQSSPTTTNAPSTLLLITTPWLMGKVFSPPTSTSSSAMPIPPPSVASTSATPIIVAPEVMRLALQFGRRRILGSTERCQAMLRTFRRVIEQDYHAPPSSHPSHGQPSQPSHAIHHSLAINRHMDQWLRPQIAYLVQARPLSVSMGHAIRALKLRISQLAPDVSEEDAKRAVIDAIDAFQRERFTVPRDLIVHFGVQKVKPQDVIVTFARSSMVEAILVEAHHRCIPFRVIVVDCKPYLEGLKVLSTLSALGVDVTYCHLEALGHMIPAATKVLLGASALFSNGALLNRAGTALVCLLAKRQAIPVIVVAQACKFSDKVGLLDSSGGHAGMYDVTPSELLTMLITEMGLLPVTSVPVVLREYNIALTNV